MQVVFVVVVTLLVHSSLAFNKLPPWFNRCKKGPTFNECALKSARDAYSHIVAGDPTYHIPSFNPLKLATISLEASNNIKLYATDIEISGFDAATIEDLDWDFDNKIVHIKMHFPSANCIGTYNMAGHILVMNLNGNGPMNITFYDQNYDIKSYYDIETIKGKEHMKLTKIDIGIHSKDCKLIFENLLNNPEISKQMNEFLNENWRVLTKELDPSIIQIMVDLAINVINYITKRVPFEDIVL